MTNNSSVVAPNAVRQALARGEVVLGTTCGLGARGSVEAAAQSGYTFAQIDLEHDHLDPERVIDLIRTGLDFGLCPIARVADHTPINLTRVLDWGATGVFVPHVQNRAQAEQIVSACKYGPRGTRNVGAHVRTEAFRLLGRREFSEFSNEDTLVWILIEDTEGVDNLEDILQVEGIDAVMPGPGDLSHQLGLAGDPHHPEVVKYVDRIHDICDHMGVATIGSQAWEPTGIKGAVARGAKLILSSSDRGLLENGFAAAYRAASSELAEAISVRTS